MAKKTGRKVKKVTELKTSKPKTLAERKATYQAELEKAVGMINGLQQRIQETQATAQRIQGAILALEEMETDGT